MISYLRADVVCDKCGSGQSVIANNMRQVRIKLRRNGWNCDRRDLCPNCAPRTAPNAKAQPADA